MKKRSKSSKSNLGIDLKDIILGGQDGLVNILGLVLGVAAATYTNKIVIISGLAGTFAESISMAAVAYTSTQAAKAYYISRRIKIPREDSSPEHSALVVGISSLLGSFIPLLPFFFFDITNSIILSLIFSLIALYLTGYYKSRITIGNPSKEGLKLAAIGVSAALVGYVIGLVLGAL